MPWSNHRQRRTATETAIATVTGTETEIVIVRKRKAHGALRLQVVVSNRKFAPPVPGQAAGALRNFTGAMAASVASAARTERTGERAAPYGEAPAKGRQLDT